MRDLSLSVQFYRDVLGMRMAFTGPFSGPSYEAILGVRAAAGEVATLVRDGLRLELFQFSRPRAAVARTYEADAPGITHFCLAVADIHDTYRRLLESGVRFHSEPQDFGEGIFAAYARDPDGNIIELLQLPAGIAVKAWNG